MYLSENISYLRKKNRMSQGEVGDILGKTHGAVGAWEKSKNSPPVDAVVKMCEIFKVSVEDILFKNLAIEDYNETQDNVGEGISLKETVELLRFKVAMYEKHIKEKAPELVKELGIDSGG